jgi:hypothetical protein
VSEKTIAVMRYNKILFFLLSVAFCSAAFGQNNPADILDSFSGKFITAIRTHDKQRAYLVTDKSVFTAGESIWFRAFLLNAVSQKTNTKSNFLFVDLVNEKDVVIKGLILDAVNKQFNSRIVLPDSIATGYYWLRAYTRQMAEGDTNNICVKPIYIVGITNDNNPGKSLKNRSNPDHIPTITFYPEGGSVITGVNSTVAFRASDINGAPVSIEGYVKDNRDAIIAPLTTNISGLGKFDFEPSGYKKYKAVFNWLGKEISFPLPSFNFYAGQVSVTKQSTGYKLRVLLGDSVYGKDVVTYLLGVSKDSLIFASIGKGLYEVNIDKEKLPAGIATFYLFDKDFNLLSERSVYIHDNNVRINVITDKNIYARRDKVTLNISITDAGQHPIPSLVAVSVIDSLFSDPRKPCTLPDAAYNQQAVDNMFLALHACLTDEETDLLMLVKNNTYQTLSKTINQPTAGDTDSLLYIKGLILNEKNEPSANKALTLFINSGGLVLYQDTTDNKGRFCFPFENYTDSMQFAIEVKNLNGRTQNAKIVLDTFRYPKLHTSVSLKQFWPLQTNLVKKYLNTIYGDKQSLPPVTVKYQVKAVNYNQLKRVSSNSAILTADDLDERTSVGNAVLKVGGMHLLNGFLVINGPTRMQAPDPTSEPMLLIDGVQVSLSADLAESSPVMSYLNSLNPKDIDFIEILKGPEAANYGVRGGHGVILVNLLSTRRELKLNGNNLKTFYAKGVSNPVLFPNVDYQQKDVKAATRSDNRSTLFWNGSFLSDDAHNTALTFYTSDIPATYKVTITGITVHGDFIYKTTTFQSQ